MPTVPDRREVTAVYAAGLAQGVALVTFPAASSILTSPDWYDLSSTAYGGLFLPQAIAAIAASLAGARLAGTHRAQAAAADRARRRPARDDPAVREPVPHRRRPAAVPRAARRDDQPRHRVRVRGAVAQHLRGLVLPGDARTARSCTSTRCWGWGRRSRRCSSRCSSAWASGPACRSSSPWRWPACCCSPGRSRSQAGVAGRRATGRRPRDPGRRSGSSPRSRSATASSRR